MLYSFCSQLLVDIGLRCSQVCLVALPITFFSKFGMCWLPKDTSMSTTLQYEPCFRRVRISRSAAIRFVMAACPSVTVRSRLDGFHEMSWKLLLRTIMAVCWENPDRLKSGKHIWHFMRTSVGCIVVGDVMFARKTLSSAWKVLGC